ncbi:MAG TPA: ABC transporter substrate-binding protein [Solirubrobacterales bacterium]|nr:ABC transporter substrate-binding protein [Solirubrobacterales bacterium]
MDHATAEPGGAIASLVPSATELAFALGLGPRLAAVTHECDFPPGVEALPQLTRSVIEPGLSPAEIDAAVLDRTGRGEALYELDERALTELDIDLILTQQVCAVCAVSYEDVSAVAARLPGRPEVLSLDPSRIDDILEDAVRLGKAAGDPGAGISLRDRLRSRIEAVRGATEGGGRPRVAALEWLDPPYAAGHWVPEMIEAAGGEDALAAPGERSRTVGWEEVASARPDVVIVMPCGLYCAEAAHEAGRHRERLDALGAQRLFAVDAASSFSRPGPRIADGVELLGHLLHPGLAADPGTLRFEALGVGRD